MAGIPQPLRGQRTSVFSSPKSFTALPFKVNTLPYRINTDNKNPPNPRAMSRA